MTEQLILQPDQHYRECGCPAWVLRCAHWEGRTLMLHDFSGGAIFICVTDRPLEKTHAENWHGGSVLSMGNHEVWPMYEAEFLAGTL